MADMRQLLELKCVGLETCNVKYRISIDPTREIIIRQQLILYMKEGMPLIDAGEMNNQLMTDDLI